jgi:hypothetical protein
MSCPLSLKAISAHNSSQRDIKLSLERMSANISLLRENRRKREGVKNKESEKERESKIHTSFCEEEIDWFTNGI